MSLLMTKELPRYECLLEAAKEAQEYNNKVDNEQRSSAIATAVKLGNKIYAPTEAQMELWRSTGRQIWKQFDSKIDPAFLKRIVDTQK